VQTPAGLRTICAEMIKTLRITSVVAVILAGVFFVFPIFYGVRRDERIAKVLNSPGTIEQFRNAKGSNTKGTESRTSPLVQQAEAFASFLNPKPTAIKSSPTSKTPLLSRSLPATTPKFDVFATSYCPESPKLSLALIDEPGRGRRWVRQSSMVGHILIEEVKDGLVIAKSGDKTFEIMLKKGKSVEIPSVSAPSTPAGQSRSRPAVPTVRRTAPTIKRPATIPKESSESSDEDSRAEELISRLEDLKKTTAVPGGEERAARIAELIAKVKASREGTEDANESVSLVENSQQTSVSSGQEDEKLETTSKTDETPEKEPE